MNPDPTLFPDEAPTPAPTQRPRPPVPGAAPRLRRPERHQIEFREAALDQLLPPEHPARIVWAFVDQRDVTPLLATVRAVAGHPGQPANDPRILMALWLYATIEGVGSARALDRLCREHIA
jgi:transposase